MRRSAASFEPSPGYFEKVSDCLTDDFIYILPWLVISAGIAVAIMLLCLKLRKRLCIMVYADPSLPPVSLKVKKGRAAILPTPIRAGYTFLGWEYPDGRRYNGEVILSNGCLFAKWEKNPNN